jgi:hypothetical protein
MRSLDDAVRILRRLRKELAPGSLAIWRVIDHACKYIERQISAGLEEEPIVQAPPDNYRSLPLVHYQ